MPAEWEAHEATWLSWPKDPDTFPDQILERVEAIYVQMIRALADETVHVLVDNEDYRRRAIRLLDESEVRRDHVVFHRIPTADVWVRDYGPIFVTRKSPPDVASTKWLFNAWGDKYEELKQDNRAGEEIASAAECPTFRPGVVLEGGSIDANGKGTCLTTEQCVLNPNRNLRLSRAQIETYLNDYLGVDRLIWLKEGIVGDDTDGHIDDIARFVNPRTVVCAVEEDLNDANYNALKTNFKLLEQAVDQDGERLDVIPLPMPGAVTYRRRRLPASYANLYIANGVVLVPVFHHANDEKALKILEGLFPTRKVLGIYCEPLLAGFGGIHCVTQQQPRG